ncbi:MAG: 3-deoxy-D-manno-octulosonic acid transferase [Bacteroidales bacterium]|jgi:3-deoxy-D-manno-octulosonic-acid transferase|nr:3-deoxy-D-manno-octulosonic acid transferase [Bacteroidales bacterium]
MKLLYNLGILIFKAGGWFISPFNHKAGLWIRGQKNWFKLLKEKINYGDKYIWIHCASLGEFEQGRPVIEAIKKEKPHCKIILTFFSPSGYEIRKSYHLADNICYLPPDTPGNAEKFIGLINPELAIFVKYEFWYNYICELRRRSVPLYLISGIFRREQHFFRWYGSFFRDMLEKFSMIYVQDIQSADILAGFGIRNVSVAGDTRFDRVLQVAGNTKDILQLEIFRGAEKLVLAGSSWKPDEEIISGYINNYPERLKWVFAPHEIGSENIGRIEKLLKVKCARFSEFNEEASDARVLIIDNIGMLSSAYRYAYIAVVGGGFGKGIHNILEPACWGLPVLFGPNHLKFREAADLISLGAARSFKTYADFERILNIMINDGIQYKNASHAAGNYVKANAGATDKIIHGIA